MDDEQRLRTLLVRAAEPPGEPVTVVAADLVRKARRRRTRVRSFSVTAVVAVLAGAAVIPFAAFSSSAIPANGTQPGPSVTPYPTSGPATAAALQHDHWTVLPTAPIAARANAAAVWDGHEMLVWGGAAGLQQNQLLSNGASYDPVSRTWKVLPRSPLTARTGMAAVWTGKDLFIWGGSESGDGTGPVAGNGALYDPRTGHWHLLPRSPLPAQAGAQAFWTGGEVVLIPTAQTGGADTVGNAVAAYNPSTNSWRKLAPIPASPQETIAWRTAVQAGSTIFLLEASVDRVSNQSAVAVLSFSTTATRWTAHPAGDRDAPVAFDQTIWTGQDLVVPAVEQCPPDASCPIMPGRGFRFDPFANEWSALPAGPVDNLGPTTIWTGAAMLSFDTTSYTTGPGQVLRPAQAAVWDPSNDAWSQLPGAPYAGSGPAAVWTGHSLLEWVGVVPPADNGHVASGPLRAIGLEFGPGSTAASGQ